MAQHFRWADVFLLPSICEGSATVTYEAIAHGLPVVTTTSTGTVVEHGVSGFIGEAGDIEFLMESLNTLREHPGLRLAMGEAALERARSFTLAKYGERLLTALQHDIRLASK